MTIYEPGAEAIHMAQTEQTLPTVEAAEFERQHFALSLAEKGLVSEEFYHSGALDRFGSDEATGIDALSHILIGDDEGGAHHLSTIMALDIRGRTIASTLAEEARPHKTQAQLRGEQRVGHNGVFRANQVVIDGVNGVAYQKLRGSTMFPNEWSTQQVLESIVAAADSPGTYNPARESFTHVSEINGVSIQAITDAKTGKIITACPK
jgi:hypothetical protein